MSGTADGGRKAALTNKKLFGADFYRRIGSEGGKKEVPKGFAVMDRKKHIMASIKGGTISRRTKEVPPEALDKFFTKQ